MKILLSGATGFIGRNLVPLLLSRGHQLFGLVRKPSLDLDPQVQWIEQDLAEPFQRSKFPERMDVIIHLAQSKRYREFPDGANDIFNVNIKGTFDLLEYGRSAGIAKFIFASSGGIYGYSYERFVETDPANPLNFYLSSKYSAELLIANYQRFFKTIVFRFFFVYGPGQRDMLIPTLLRKVISGETVIIDGTPGLRINPTYIGDAIRVFEKALWWQNSDLFNVAGDEVVSILDLVHLIESATGKKAAIQHAQAAPGGDLVGDNSRMKAILGVYPQTSLLEGLKRTMQCL